MTTRFSHLKVHQRDHASLSLIVHLETDRVKQEHHRSLMRHDLKATQTFHDNLHLLREKKCITIILVILIKLETKKSRFPEQEASLQKLNALLWISKCKVIRNHRKESMSRRLIRITGSQREMKSRTTEQLKEQNCFRNQEGKNWIELINSREE